MMQTSEIDSLRTRIDALHALREAERIEREYGDAPIYGPLARALALAVEES